MCKMSLCAFKLTRRLPAWPELLKKEMWIKYSSAERLRRNRFAMQCKLAYFKVCFIRFWVSLRVDDIRRAAKCFWQSWSETYLEKTRRRVCTVCKSSEPLVSIEKCWIVVKCADADRFQSVPSGDGLHWCDFNMPSIASRKKKCCELVLGLAKLEVT